MGSDSSVSFIYLSEPDLLRVGVKDFGSCIDTCEEVFKLVSKGDYIMGGAKHNEHGSVISFPDKPAFEGMPSNGPERRFIAMPAYVGGEFRMCGVKWYGSNVKNREKGLPRSILTLELNDPDTGAPVSFMSANLISAMRTGCVPAVGAKYLCPDQADSCVLIGCGPVNRSTLCALLCVEPSISKVVVNAAHPESARKCCSWIEERFGISAVVEQDFNSAVGMGDIVVIGASPKEPLYVDEGLVKEGALVLLNSPIDASPEFWTSSDLVFDNPKMHERYMEEAEREIGDVVQAVNGFGTLYQLVESGDLPGISQIGGLGDYCLGKSHSKSGRQSALVTSGQAILDVAYGTVLYHKAVELGIGTSLSLWDEPEWF